MKSLTNRTLVSTREVLLTGLLVLGLVVVLPTAATAAAPGENILGRYETTAPAGASVTRIDEHSYQVGGIIIRKDTKEISFDARINQDGGPIEYLLVTDTCLPRHTGGGTRPSQRRAYRR